MSELPRRKAERRTGDERFVDGDKQLSFTLRDFWCWSTSDLLNNTTRGVLAEFLVASAVEIPTSGVRDPWAAYDLETADGLKIEVKSAAHLQSWAQKRPSVIIFNVPKTRAWSPDTNELASESARQADVYVFAVLAHQDKATVNPLDISQWQFFVLSSQALNQRTRSQHSITIASVKALSTGPTSYHELAAAIRNATRR
jgi:hypothetical protein